MDEIAPTFSIQLSAEIYAKAFLASPDPIVISRRADGYILEVNQSFEKLFGYRREEILGKTTLSLNLYQNPHDRERAVSRLEEQGYLRNFELVMQTRSGQLRQASLSIEEMTIQGTPCMLTIFHDITNRKESEKALAHERELLQKIIDHIPVMISIYRPDTHVVLLNREFERLTGWSTEEASRINLMEQCYPDPEYRQVVGEFMESLRDGWMDIEMRAKDGSIIESSWSNIKLSDDTHVGIGIDIHERKQTERVLQKMNENLELLVRERTNDLLQAYAELAEVRRHMMDSVEAERLRLAQELHDGAMQEIFSITYSLYNMSEDGDEDLEAKRTAELKSRLDGISEMLRSITRELRPSTLAPFGLEKAIREHAERFQQDHTDLSICLDLQPDGTLLAEQIRLTLFRIYQVALTNIVRHAQATRADVRFNFNGNQITLEIQDNGIGFDVPGRWITFARGGHLGLVGAAERAEALGGKLEVESQPGSGTRIRVVLPRTEANHLPVNDRAVQA